MTAIRIPEVFTTGCPACNDTVSRVKRLTRPSRDVAALDMHDASAIAKQKTVRLCLSARTQH